jgi:hypothetical protein
VCFTTTRKGENGSSIELEKARQGHRIAYSQSATFAKIDLKKPKPKLDH